MNAIKSNPTKYATGRPEITVTTATEADKALIAKQAKCPVMDEPLNAMDGPYKVNANGKAVYICCPGCAKKIAAEPQKYLAVLNEQGINAPVIR